MHPILVAADLGDSSPAAVGRARRIAAARGAELCLLHVAADEPDSGEAAALERRLMELAGGSAAAGASARIRSGKASEAILEEAERLGAALIVLGDHGRPRLRDALLGTTGTHVVQDAVAPVLVAQNNPQAPYAKVMAAVDEDMMEPVLEAALGVGEAQALWVVHAHIPSLKSVLTEGNSMARVIEAHEAAIRAAVARLRGTRAAPELHCIVEDADVVDVIVKAWRQVRPDLVVVGTHGRGALSRLLQASVAETVLLGCPSDILVVPPPV